MTSAATYERVPQHEEDGLPQSPGNDPENQRSNPRSIKRKLDRKLLLAIFLSLPLIGVTIFYLFGFATPHDHHQHHIPGLSLGEMRNATYAQRIKPIEWLSNGEDGQFVQRTADGFSISKWGSQEEPRIVAPLKLTDEEGLTQNIVSFKLNQQQTYAILVTNVQKHWRHSTFSRYWLLEVESKSIVPLHQDPISIASWSPDGQRIAYVLNNDIYVFDVASKSSKQITSDGGANVFNGIPDWVYEEEVFSGDSALWWSTQGRYLAYIRTNDSSVPKFPIPYFFTAGHDSDAAASAAAYPDLVELKYPKPGFPNPNVEFWIYSTERRTTQQINIPTSLDEPIITEVIWVNEDAVVKIMSRESDFLEVWIVDPRRKVAKRSRSYSSESLGGSWFEVTHNSHPVGAEGYVDTIDVNGYNHLGFFSPANSSDPIVLTSGDWEVQDTSISVNTETRHVYFHATKRESTEISLYRVSLGHPGREPELVAFEGEGVYSATFSPDASFATVSYTAPYKPLIQKVVKLSGSTSTGNTEQKEQSEWLIEDNKQLHELLESRNLLHPDSVIYGRADVGNGIEVNYREIRPSSFDPNKKHPLLFFNYGGPGSQQVLKKLTVDFQRIFAETHNAIVVTVDPRGTGNRGRQFRASVRDHLGDYEADDVIAVAKLWNEKDYIDSNTTAIWGWSYGGFLTLKTLERDVDLAFKYGVAVAPVTDWSLYDSIYTERYMHTPAHNKDGYKSSGINNVTNIARHERFLVMHGTGDDNVHFQNTLQLLDKLDLAGVENYDVHVFPDSDHSINFHNANTIVNDKIDQWLRIHQNN